MHPRPTYPASRTPLPKTEVRLPSAPSKLHLASTRGISVATTINIGSFDDCKTILNSLTGTCSGLFPGGIFTVNKKTFGTFRSGCIHLYGTRTIFSSTIAVNSLALILCDTEASRKLSYEIRTGQQDGGQSITTIEDSWWCPAATNPRLCSPSSLFSQHLHAPLPLGRR